MISSMSMLSSVLLEVSPLKYSVLLAMSSLAY